MQIKAIGCEPFATSASSLKTRSASTSIAPTEVIRPSRKFLMECHPTMSLTEIKEVSVAWAWRCRVPNRNEVEFVRKTLQNRSTLFVTPTNLSPERSRIAISWNAIRILLIEGS
jgi:hypothetical protein